MEVLDLLYHSFLFTANSLKCQPTTSQYFWHLTLQMLVLAATPISSSLSEYASWTKATVMFTQHEYPGTFSTSPVVKFYSASHCTHQSHNHGPLHSPPTLPAVQLRWSRCPSIPSGAPQPWLTFVWLFCCEFVLSQCSSAGIGTP